MKDSIPWYKSSSIFNTNSKKVDLSDQINGFMNYLPIHVKLVYNIYKYTSEVLGKSHANLQRGWLLKKRSN